MYYDLGLGSLISESQFREKVMDAGIEQKLFDDFLHHASSIGNTPQVILVHKAILLLKKRQYPVSAADLSEIHRTSLLKFSGTDGVRGIVGSSAAQSIQAFLQERIITLDLCRMLASGFASMLEKCKPSLRRCVALAEDGRDQSEETGLVSAVTAALQGQGFDVEHLGVLPTPALAAWSLDRECGAIMVTASHNPHQYNGMKFFIEGKKLFPEGECGEFALSSYALENEGRPRMTNGAFSQLTDKSEEAKGLFSSLFTNTLSETELGRLNGCHCIIDCANGASSYVLPPLLHALGISFHLVADKPAKKAINKGCGAARFEGFYSVGPDESFLSPLVGALFSLGPTYENKRVFGITLDGDGDRALVLVPDSEGRTLSVLHGDELLLLLARRTLGSKGIIRVTLESDNALVPAIRGLSSDFSIEMTAVGDRHLSKMTEGSIVVLVGGEDSGHLVFPVRVGNGYLYSGNGVLSALAAISVFVRDNLTLPLFSRKGVDKRSVSLKDTGLWFPNSALWNEVQHSIEQYIPEDLNHVRFASESDIVSYRTADEDLLYVRASGTEPKLTVSFSRIGDTGFNMLVQSLTRICAHM